jgi:hypothetical protein
MIEFCPKGFGPAGLRVNLICLLVRGLILLPAGLRAETFIASICVNRILQPMFLIVY